MANTISTSTNANATAYSPAQLVAVSASGDALVVWYDGSNVKWSYASSPYSSWTTASLITSISGRWEASLYKLSNDNALLVCSNGSGNMVSYLFTYSSGSHNWSAGSAVTVLSSGGAFNGGSVGMAADAQGRIWAAWANNSHVVQIYYTADNGSTWNASTTFTQVSGGDDTCVSLAYIGNYIVTSFCGASAVWKYARIDAHSASLGSWSSATTVTNCNMDNTTSNACLRGAPGSNYGILCGDFGNIPTQNYNSNTDTWSSVTNIGSSSDRQPTLATDGTDLYCLWAKFSASNNFSLVYKKWVASTQTWDSASTQLEASGTNIARPSAGITSGLLGFVYTVGTASPWNVNFDTASVSSVTTSTRTISSVTAALQVANVRTMASVTASLQVTGTRVVSSVTAAILTANTRTMASVTAALLTTPTRAITTITASIQTANVRPISNVTAALQTALVRTIASVTAAVLVTGDRPILVTAALLVTLRRDILADASISVSGTSSRIITGVTVAVMVTSTRSIPLSASISSGATIVIIPNATVIVPSGQATAIIPSGEATATATSGQATAIIRSS